MSEQEQFNWDRRLSPEERLEVQARMVAFLHDLTDMLNGEGIHGGHTREQIGRCVVCSCGTRAQGRLPTTKGGDK